MPPLHLALLTAVLLAGQAASQLDDVFAPVLLDAGYGLVDIAAGDVDGDGLPDLVVAFDEGIPEGVRLALGLDGTRFAPFVDWSGANGEVLLADVDQDGLADLIQCDENLHTVSVRRSLGGGALGEPSRASTGTHPHDPHAADMDGDGVLDVVVACNLRVAVALGVGDGTLLPTALLEGPIGPGAETLAVGDLDGDGVPDVAVNSIVDDSTSVLLGLGNGTLSPPVVLDSEGLPGDVEVGDIDGDGQLDLLVFAEGSPMLAYDSVLSSRRGLGNGSFGPARLTPLLGMWHSWDMVLSDLDEDGLLDAIVPDSVGNRVLLVPGTGGLEFGAPTAIGASEKPTRLELLDLNADGDLDLLVGSEQVHDVAVLHGEGDGTVLEFASTRFRPRVAAVADLDLDGDLDLAAVTDDPADFFPDKPSLEILLNKGVGRLTVAHEIPEVIGSGSAGAMDAADHDGDGVPDLLVVGQNGVFLRGLGNGSFAPPRPTDHTISLAYLALGDLDGDGTLDTVTMRTTQALLFVNTGNGDGTFGPTVTYSTDDPGDRGDGLALADVTGDGQLDAVVAVGDGSFQDGFLTVFAGAGDCSFTELLDSPSMIGMRHLVLGDFDEDGVLDAAASVAPSHLLVQRGLGGGAYDAPVLHDVDEEPWGLDVADLDGDGHLDLAVACLGTGISPFEGEGSSSVCLLTGAGDGNFGAPVCLRMGSSAIQPLFADFDGDARLDLAVAHAGSQHLAVLLARNGPWDTLVHGLPGAGGIPRLIGWGAMQGGDPVGVTLRDAPPAATAWLIVAPAAVFAPFKAGTLVPDPSPPGALLPVVVGPDGSVELESVWPVGLPADVNLWWQAWIADTGGPAGFAASNALHATTPP